jgi:RNA polymerase sigma-70 factor (ECF subfamily)
MIRFGTGTRSGHTAAQDAALVARVRAGDRSAFTELYQTHAGAVQMAVRDRLRDPDSVADVVQEAFTRALARLDTLREADRFRPWLLSIARNAAVDQGRHRQRVVPLSDEAAGALPDRGESPSEVAEARDMVALLGAGVATLSARDVKALSLVSGLGCGPAEVGAALGVTSGAAKVIVHRARRRLRNAISLPALDRSPGLLVGAAGH